TSLAPLREVLASFGVSLLTPPFAESPYLYGLNDRGGEKLMLDEEIAGKLSIGSHANGLAYAMGQRIPGVFQIRADLLTQIPVKKDLLAASSEKAPAS
ncbi:MAG TPA: hypothetical protein VLL94_14740, partial [Nitrospiraceae bacterium]|nr:hypothetical protein [Nitrospiraceae bacterium]